MNFVMGAGRRSLARVFNGCQTLGEAIGLLFAENAGADEFRVQRAEEAQSGFQRSFVRRQVGAVQRITHFQAQAVAGAESAGFGSGGQKGFKPFDAFRSRAEEFEAVFPGVAGTADDEVRAVHRDAGDAVAGREFHSGNDFGEDCPAKRSLNGQAHVFVGMVFQRYVCGFVRGEPGEVFTNLGGVHHHEEGFRFHAVQDQIVDDSSLFVKHDGVLALADVQLVDVVGEHGVQPCRRVRAGYRELAHMGDVKDAAGLAHRFVFVQNAGVLHGHVPAGEGNHFSSKFNVFGCQGCGFDVGIRHKVM